jgi:hypothetical protein
LSAIFGLNYGEYIKDVNGWSSSSLKFTNLLGLRFLPSDARSGANAGFGFPNGELATIWTSVKIPMDILT